VAEGKEKNKKKWCVDNMDSEDSDFVLKEDFKVHGDAGSDG
jgi:hypothetical protein